LTRIKYIACDKVNPVVTPKSTLAPCRSFFTSPGKRRARNSNTARAEKNKSLIRNRFRGRTSCVVVAAAREAERQDKPKKPATT
jgi:hypothetical protein